MENYHKTIRAEIDRNFNIEPFHNPSDHLPSFYTNIRSEKVVEKSWVHSSTLSRLLLSRLTNISEIRGKLGEFHNIIKFNKKKCNTFFFLRRM